MNSIKVRRKIEDGKIRPKVEVGTGVATSGSNWSGGGSLNGSGWLCGQDETELEIGVSSGGSSVARKATSFRMRRCVTS